MLSLFTRILTSKYKDLFTVRLGAALLLGKLGVVGVGAKMLTPVFAGTLGLFLELGVLKIDLTIDSLAEGRNLEEFKEDALKAYEHATKKVYDENKKQKIREDYLRIIGKFAAV